MQVHEVDERDHDWELDRPNFRVYFFTENQPGSFQTDTYDIEDVSLSTVRAWAQDQARGRAIGICALVDVGGSRGLVWIDGYDRNSSDPPPWV